MATSTTLTGVLTDTKTGLEYDVITTTSPHVVPVPPPPPVPPPTPVVVESPDNTAVTNTTGSLIDASLVKWMITAGGKCLVGTVLDTTTANVVGILLHSHKVYQWNAAGNWYVRAVGQNPPWTSVTGDPRPVTPPPPPPPVVPPPPPPPTPASTESADLTTVPPATHIVDSSLAVWTIVGGQIAMNGKPVADTGSVALLKYVKHPTAAAKGPGVFQKNMSNNWYGPSSAMTGGVPIPGDPSISPPPPPPPPTPMTGGFTVTQANGFRDSSGTRWEFRGYNCWPGEFDRIKLNLYSKFGGANFVRVVLDQGWSVDRVRPMINELTGRKIVCLIDYHDGMQGGTIGWYQAMANEFRNNPLCLMQTPNEAGGDVAGDQIKIIQALRAANWKNPIGVELRGGYQFDNVAPVQQACPQGNQLFLSPHNYGDWWNGAMQNTARDTGWYSVVTEFGDSMDGSSVDNNGVKCVLDIIQTQQAHQDGACFWSATNGYHEGDNLFNDTSGNTLTHMGQTMHDMGWLSGAVGPSLVKPTVLAPRIRTADEIAEAARKQGATQQARLQAHRKASGLPHN